jgi:hypothetical protein
MGFAAELFLLPASAALLVTLFLALTAVQFVISAGALPLTLAFDHAPV